MQIQAIQLNHLFTGLNPQQAQGLWADPNAITAPQDASMDLLLEKGDKLETQFKIHGDVFATSEAPNVTLEITQDIFMRITQEGSFFSLDGKEWKTITELFNGNFGFSLSLQEDKTQLIGELFHEIKNPNSTETFLLSS